MKSFLKKVQNWFLAEPENDDALMRNADEKNISNQVIFDELIEHFSEILKKESFAGKMLFPMSFNILLTPDDLEDRKQAIPYLIPIILKGFYNIINNTKETSAYKDYEPTAPEWYIQFSSCGISKVSYAAAKHQIESDTPATLKAENAPQKEMLLIRKGHIATAASLRTFNLRDAKGTSDSSVRLSLKLDKSEVITESNINIKALRGVDVISDTIFRSKFDVSLPQDVKKIENSITTETTDCIARLKYFEGDDPKVFYMSEKQLFISGKYEIRSGRTYLKIEDAEIQDNHVAIKYISSENKFKITAFGPTNLDGVEMDISKGGNITYVDLPDKTSIFMNNSVKVFFEIM